MCGSISRHDFAVGPEHEPQHAVGARVLRAHVDEHLVGADVELDDPRVVVDHLCHGSVLGAGGNGEVMDRGPRPGRQRARIPW